MLDLRIVRDRSSGSGSRIVVSEIDKRRAKHRSDCDESVYLQRTIHRVAIRVFDSDSLSFPYADMESFLHLGSRLADLDWLRLVCKGIP